MTNLSNIKPKKNRESKHTNKQSINHQEWVMLMKKESIQEKPNNHTWRWYSPASSEPEPHQAPSSFPFSFSFFLCWPTSPPPCPRQPTSVLCPILPPPPAFFPGRQKHKSNKNNITPKNATVRGVYKDVYVYDGLLT